MPNQDAVFDYQHPDKLRFDPDNPRFGGELVGKSQDEIQEYLYGKPHFAAELVDSLLQNGYIDYEPLITRKEADHYIVIEGNRRLAAVRHILANSDQYRGRKDDLTRIPILSFPENPSPQQENEMRVYLGVRHLFGFRQWPSLSKAKFLDQEIHSKEDLGKVVKELGLSKQEIRRLLVPFRTLTTAKESLPEDEDYWKLGESLSRTGIKGYIGLDVDKDTLEVKKVDRKKLRSLLGFVYGTFDPKTKLRDPDTAKVTDTRQLSRLSQVLDDDKASAALEAGSNLDDAMLFVETKDESVRRLSRILQQLRTLLREVFVLKPSSVEGKRLLAHFREFEAAAKAFIKQC
ncbi:MAG: hypothetical protein LAN37_05480 [Acidobacteriia bacterium]|nr:hypothetical protein [Terriglobia bacterium]